MERRPKPMRPGVWSYTRAGAMLDRALTCARSLSSTKSNCIPTSSNTHSHVPVAASQPPSLKTARRRLFGTSSSPVHPTVTTTSKQGKKVNEQFIAFSVS